MASDSSKRPGAAANEFLTPVMTLKGHEPVTRTLSNGEKHTTRSVSSVCYFSDGERLISGSIDKTARQWDLRTGKEIEARGYEQGILAVRISKDGQWIVTTSGYYGQAGELKVCEVKTGIVRTFEGHSGQITSIDISADSTLLVSGSNDSVRIWDLDTGKLVFKIAGVKRGFAMAQFSQDSKKLALKWPGVDNWLEVWDVQAQKLDVSIQKRSWSYSTSTPVFWTTKDKTIVVNSTKIGHVAITPTNINTVYEFDSLTLETLGAPFEGHTDNITGLALSFDCAFLASASWDQTVKLWAFESRQLLASFDFGIQFSAQLLFSPNSYQLACTKLNDTNIYIYNIPPEILANISPAQEVQPNTSDLLHSDAIPCCKPVISLITSFAHQQQKPFPTTHSQRPTFFHYLRKFMSSSRTNAAPPVQNDQLHNPLDFPATSPLPRNFLPLAQGSSSMNPHENVRPIPTLPSTESSATTSTTFKARLHNLSTWWPVRTGYALPPIVDVPLAQGKERNASADAPPEDSGEWVADEDYVPSRLPSTNPNSQPPAVQVNTGEHGNGRLCGCF